jgi:2-dehydropantoate 2-reductase
MLRVAVVGSGAVGGYYGAKLAQVGHDVTFIARGAHLRAIRERGLLIWSPLGDFLVRARAEQDPVDIGKVDLVLFAVKAYDTPDALRLLPAITGPSTLVLTLQNGVDSADDVASVVGKPPVIAGATYIATALTAPGLIEQTGTHRRIVFGEVFHPSAAPTERVLRIAEALTAADIQAQAVPDARLPLWEKFIYLAAYAGFAGAARQPAGPLWADPVTRDQFLAATEEIAAVARAEGVPIAKGVRDRITSYMDSVPKTMRASLFIDLQAGKRIEVEALQGAVVRRGAARGVPTPIMRTLYAVLRAASARA